MRGLPSTFVSRLFAAGAIIAVSSGVARLFGPEARGAVGMFIVLRLAIHAFATLGIPTANTWAVARDPRAYGPAARASLALGLLLGALVLVALSAVLVWNPAWFDPVTPSWTLVFFASAPAILVTQLAGGVLLGAGRVGAWNSLTVVNRSLLLASLGLACLAPLSHLGTVVAGFAVAEWVTFVVALALLRPEGGLAPRVDRDLWRATRRYGAFAWAHGALTFALLRVDVLVLGTWRGTREAGLYDAASLAREVVMFLPWIAGMLFLPRVASDDVKRARSPRPMGRVSIATMVLATAALVAFPREFVTGVHGEKFFGAAPLVPVLVASGVFAGVSNLCLQYLLGKGAPRAVVVAPAVALAVNLLGNAVAVPAGGATGCAWVALWTQAVLFALSGAAALRLARDQRKM